MSAEKRKIEHTKFTDAVYRYETIVIKKQAEKHTTETSVVRNLKVFYLGKIKENSYFRIICLKYIFSNEDRSDVIFLKKLSYLWDNIEILVDKENKIFKILNLCKLRLQWISMKEKLSLDYQGNAVDNYFLTIDDLLENEMEVCRFLNSYKMFGMLFNGQYRGYDEFGNKTRKISENNNGFLENLKMIKRDTHHEIRIGISAEENKDFESYDGIFHYENNHLIEAFLNFETADKHVKYSLLWIG